MTNRRTFLEQGAPAHDMSGEMSGEERMKGFSKEADISRHGQPEEIAEFLVHSSCRRQQKG